jgi:hypothetical protein
LASKPAIARVLNAYGLKHDDLGEQFRFLMNSGLGDLPGY